MSASTWETEVQALLHEHETCPYLQIPLEYWNWLKRVFPNHFIIYFADDVYTIEMKDQTMDFESVNLKNESYWRYKDLWHYLHIQWTNMNQYENQRWNQVLRKV